MPANKNALIRYRTIDNCLRNRYRRWTLDDLVQACCDALYDMEGIKKGVCARTVQMDMQIMRSDKLGYNAPIEVYDKIYYNVSSTDSTLCAQPCYCQTVETHSCVSASCQVFATGDFIRQSCLPRRKNASLQVFVELTLL